VLAPCGGSALVLRADRHRPGKPRPGSASGAAGCLQDVCSLRKPGAATRGRRGNSLSLGHSIATGYNRRNDLAEKIFQQSSMVFLTVRARPVQPAAGGWLGRRRRARLLRLVLVGTPLESAAAAGRRVRLALPRPPLTIVSARPCSSRLKPMNHHDRNVVDPEILVGKPVVKGTRRSIDFFAWPARQGWGASKIPRNGPGPGTGRFAGLLGVRVRGAPPGKGRSFPGRVRTRHAIPVQRKFPARCGGSPARHRP
jgi:hypothetical protein